MSTYAYERPLVIQAAMSERAAFIRNTYAHLAGAILAFVGLEFLLFKLNFAEQYMATLMTSPGLMLVLFIGFIGTSYLANYWAMSGTSRPLQYAGLGLYVAVEALIFVPLLYFVNQLEIQKYGGAGHLIGQAGIMTLAIFAGLTMTVFITRKDYSFLGPIISLACFGAMGLMLAGFLFGFSLGLFFSLFMVAIASASILYQTSGIMYHYRTDQYVAASLGLFASVALLFYYILRILYASNRN